MLYPLSYPAIPSILANLVVSNCDWPKARDKGHSHSQWQFGKWLRGPTWTGKPVQRLGRTNVASYSNNVRWFYASTAQRFWRSVTTDTLNGMTPSWWQKDLTHYHPIGSVWGNVELKISCQHGVQERDLHLHKLTHWLPHLDKWVDNEGGPWIMLGLKWNSYNLIASLGSKSLITLGFVSRSQCVALTRVLLFFVESSLLESLTTL